MSGIYALFECTTADCYCVRGREVLTMKQGWKHSSETGHLVQARSLPLSKFDDLKESRVP